MDPSLIQILIGAGSTIIAAAIASLLSLQAVRIQERRQKDATETENAEKVSNMAVKLIEPLENRIVKLEKKIKDLEQERDDLKDWAERLCCQVRDMGGTPVRFEEKTRPIK